MTIPEYDDPEDDMEVVDAPRRSGSPNIFVRQELKY